MQIEIAQFGKMSQSGSSLLKLIQNNDLPILDLLVREAVQNSLDAGIPVQGKEYVHVNLGIKTFETAPFVKYLEGVTEALNFKFGATPQKAIYIEDMHTTGLTGSLDFKNNPTGNIFKLIYGISMAQDTPGAGGSWGLGKTVYFQVGIGLVVYYSRIITDNGYEQRLAVTLVENEKGTNTFIPKVPNQISSGIAWWGQRVDESSHDTIPITDDITIRKILASLGMQPFEGEQVGTKIIIPFIDEERLLIKHEKNPDETKPWEASVVNYMLVAMQRWYAPRLGNKKYTYGKYLDGHIDGVRIEKDDFLPLFLEMQLMYNAAVSGESKRYSINNISIRNYFEHNKVNNAGRVVYKKFSKQELDMLPPSNMQSPFACANVKNGLSEQNSPLLMYTRKPGMIVSYETNGEWCKGLGGTDEGEYLIGIFVPNSDTKLLNSDEGVKDLEAYLRKSEMADHTSWTDIIVKGKPFDILGKIRGQVRRKIKDSFEEKETNIEKEVKNTFARNVGKLLLPPAGFGRRASSRNRGGNGQIRNKFTKKGNSFVITSQNYLSEGEVEVSFHLKLAKDVAIFTVELFISSENGKISAMEWESPEHVGTQFPVQITHIAMPDTVGLFGRSKALKTENKMIYAIQIEKKNQPMECKGVLTFRCLDPHVQVAIAMKPEGSDTNV